MIHSTLFCIHHMNLAKSHNESRDDSTTNIDAYYYYIVSISRV